MKPSDLYAQPAISARHWTVADGLEAMFDRPPNSHDWVPSREGALADAAAVPLTVERKLQAQGATWDVFLWDGTPFGVAACHGDRSTRVVTDPDLYARAFLAMVAFHLPLWPDEVRAPHDDARLDVLDDHAVLGAAGAMRVLPTRCLSDRASVIVDPTRLEAAVDAAFPPQGRIRGAPGVADPATADAARQAILAAASPGTRRATDFDADRATRLADEGANADIARMYAAAGARFTPSPEIGWVGVLAADDEGTYALCVRADDMGLPAGLLATYLTTQRIGAPALVDNLSTGPVLEPGEEPAPAGPRP